MEEDRLKRDTKGKASALLSCSGSESEGEEAKSQFHCKSDETVMEGQPEPEDLEDDEDDSDEDDESDDEDEETDEDDDDATKSPCDKVSLLEDESSDQGDGDDCPICLNRLKYQDIGTPESCDHSFCLDCIQLWARNVNTCPVDRREFELILARHAGEDEIFKKIPVAEKSFEAEEDTGETENDLTYCEVCGQSNREDRLLLCDGCDLGFHCECLDPPLDSVPVEEWFCPDCAEANAHRRIVNDIEEEARLLLEENSSSEALPYLRPRRRQIARTRISERVRARIQEYREGLARLVCDDKDSGAFGRGNTSELSRTRSRTRQSKASKKQSTRRKSKRPVTGKKKVLSRRKQQRAKTLKKNQVLDRFGGTSKSPKSRLAGKLGLTKPRTLRKADRTTAEQVAKENLYGIKPLSIMGHKHDLDQFDEDDSFGRSSEPQASTSMLSAAASKRSSKYSASALLSRQPVARPLLCKLPDDKANSSLFSCQSSSSGASNSSSGGAGLDLLGTIMMEQSFLHMKSKDIKINRDGSLTAKKPVVVKVKERPSNTSRFFDDPVSKEEESSKLPVENDSEKNQESQEEENSATSPASSHSKNSHRLQKSHNSSSESKEERSTVASGAESEPEAKTPDSDDTECSETVEENMAGVNDDDDGDNDDDRDREREEEDMEEDDDNKTSLKADSNRATEESEEEMEESSQDGVLDAATVSNNSGTEDPKSVSPDVEEANSDDSCAADDNEDNDDDGNDNNKRRTKENIYDPTLDDKTISEVDSVGSSPHVDLEQQSETEDTTVPAKGGDSSGEDVSSMNADSERDKVESKTSHDRHRDSDDEGSLDNVAVGKRHKDSGDEDSPVGVKEEEGNKSDKESDDDADKSDKESDEECSRTNEEESKESDDEEEEAARVTREEEAEKSDKESDEEEGKSDKESEEEEDNFAKESDDDDDRSRRHPEVGKSDKESGDEEVCRTKVRRKEEEEEEEEEEDKEDEVKSTGETSDAEVNVKSGTEDEEEEEVPENDGKSDADEDGDVPKDSNVDESESVENDQADDDDDDDDSQKEESGEQQKQQQPSKELSSQDNFEKSESAREEESDENIDSGIAGENLVSDGQTPKKSETLEEISDNFDETTSTNLVDLGKGYQQGSENFEETNEVVEKERSASDSEASSVAEDDREEKPKVPISELPRIPKRNRRDLYKRDRSSRGDGPELKSVLGRVDMSDYKMKRGWAKKERKSRWDPDDWNQSERDMDFMGSRDRKSDGNKNYHSDRSESSHESEKYNFDYKESRSRKKRHDISRGHSKSHKESTVDYRDIPHCRYSPEKSKTRKRERSRNHSRSCSRDKVFDYDKSSKRKSRGHSRDKSPGRKSKRHRSYSRSPSRKSHKDRGLGDKRRHRDERKRVEDRVHKRYSDRLEYDEKKSRHHPEEFDDWDDGSCQVIDYPVEQNESPPTKPERSKKSSDRFYKSPNDKVSENYFEKRSSQERSAFKGNKLDDSGSFYNARSTSKKQKFVDRFYKAPHLRDAGTEKFPIHLSEDETEAEPPASASSKSEPDDVKKSVNSSEPKENNGSNEVDSGNSEYDPAFPTESGSPMRHEAAGKAAETVEEEEEEEQETEVRERERERESASDMPEAAESSSVQSATVEEAAPASSQSAAVASAAASAAAAAASDPAFMLHENPSVQNLPVQSQNISFPMGLRMMPPNMQPGMPQHLLMNPMFLSRPPPFGRLPRMAGPVNRMGWPMNPSGMMQLPPSRFGPARMGPGGAMPPRPGLLNGGFESMSQEPGQPMVSFKQHPCDPRHLPTQAPSPGQMARAGLPNMPHMPPPPGSLLPGQHPPPPPPTSQMLMPPPSSSTVAEMEDGQAPSSDKSLPPNFIVPEMNQLTKLLEAQAQAQAQLAMMAEDGGGVKGVDGKPRGKPQSSNSDIDVFKIPLPPMAPPSMPPPSLSIQLMPPPDSLSFPPPPPHVVTSTSSSNSNSAAAVAAAAAAATNTFSNSNSSSNANPTNISSSSSSNNNTNTSSSNSNNNVSSSSSSNNNNNSSSSSNSSSKVYKSHQSKLSNSHRSSEPALESTEVVDMDVASPLDDDVEIELPASPELDDIDDSKLNSKDSSVIELSVAEDMPASAVELTNLTNKEKYMKKLQIQERVVDEVKLAIKPFYSGKKIDKNEYKEILRKAVPKICHSKSGNINPAKIKALIEAYVDKLCKTRRCLERRKKGGVKANGERVKKPSR